ncbi:primosomal protein N' [Candidatus Aerophobetes bacterium]|nr:primosomal protein N' [Candidatus Aerophobetes bacterium]
MKYVKVALNLPLYQSFHYRVPGELAPKIEKGKQVLVPFRNRNLRGFIVEEGEGKRLKRLKFVRRVIEDFPPLSSNFLHLGKWISEYYFCPLGEVLYSFLPASTTFKINAEDSPKNSSPFFSNFKNIENPSSGSVLLFQIEEEEEKIALCLELISKTLKENKQVILIVPEISYINSFKEIILRRLKEEIGIFHSRLSPRERYKEWERIRKGKINLIIGTRSVVFSPLISPGLLIIEEEENLSYKQIEAPRYHTREVAIKRGKIEGFSVVLFSATPSLESRYQVEKGKYKLIKIQRKEKRVPRIKIVDMRKEKSYPLSASLKSAIAWNLKERGLILLFLNRRGFASFLLCRECGKVIRCPNCNIGLSFHLRNNLICHYCNYQESVPLMCPFCGGSRLSQIGAGTEQIEMKVKKMFPQACIRRVDIDIINSSSSYREFLRDFTQGKINLLIGTQLAIKREILQKITLVGIISADISLNLPDFRATEQSFHFFNKIRNFMRREGEIIIQTYNPDHYVFANLEKEEEFYEKEMRIRKELEYPPYFHWVRILLEGRIKERVKEIAEKIDKRLKKEKVNFLGPSPCPFPRIKGKYRYHLILKSKEISEIRSILEKRVISLFNKSKGVRIVIDVDPLQTI